MKPRFSWKVISQRLPPSLAPRDDYIEDRKLFRKANDEKAASRQRLSGAALARRAAAKRRTQILSLSILYALFQGKGVAREERPLPKVREGI